MKTYILRTDASQTEVQASTAQGALEAANITDAMIADGAWAWAEAKDGSEEREYIARQNMS